MMKRFYFLQLIVLFLLGSSLMAQSKLKIGTNATNIVSSAILEVESTTGGFLLPRLTQAQRDQIVNPLAGLCIYCTDCGSSALQVFNGTSWSNVFEPLVSVAPPALPCGAYIASGVYKEFMCHNLGADTSLDPNIPVQGINGNYYLWGSITAVATASSSAGVIAGWDSAYTANGAWTDASKTANDPCPAGYRIPTNALWAAVLANNTIFRTGSWGNDGNFTAALQFGTSTAKTLTLPASSFRHFDQGELIGRGSVGYYANSYEDSSGPFFLYFDDTRAETEWFFYATGYSVRCVML